MAVRDDAVDFEDDRAMLAKDAQTRRRYLKWFNKRRDDFDSDRAYDDYLEMVEDVIYKMVHGVDLEATKTFVEKYKRENADTIAANQALRTEEDRSAAEMVAQAERDRRMRLAQVRAEDEAREKEAALKRRVAKAEELVRVAQGEEEYRRVVRKREKREKKERRRAKEAETASTTIDQQPMWFRPNFPSALPAVIANSGDQDAKRGTKLPDDDSEEAAAGGFEPELVRERADLEFTESFSLLLDLE